MIRILAAVLTAMALLAGCGGGTAQQIAAPGEPRSSAQDHAWLAEIHQANLAYIQIGRLAQQKGGSTAVREAGRMLVTDHTNLDAKVTGLAEALGLELPRTQGSANLAIAQRLAKETGTRFDRDFVDTMIEDHRRVITATQVEIAQGSSQEVRDLARDALPGLLQHLELLGRASPVG